MAMSQVLMGLLLCSLMAAMFPRNINSRYAASEEDHFGVNLCIQLSNSLLLWKSLWQSTAPAVRSTSSAAISFESILFIPIPGRLSNIQSQKQIYHCQRTIIKMPTFFWEIHDSYNLTRSCILIGINMLALVLALRSLISIARIRHKLSFESLPLSINVLALLLLLIFKLFEWSYQFGEVSSVIEVFTYFLFGYGFGLIYSEVCVTGRQLLFKRILNGFLLGNLFFLSLIIILILTKVISRTCQDNGLLLTLLGFLLEAAYYVPTVYFGIFIVKKLNENELHQYKQTRLQKQYENDSLQIPQTQQISRRSSFSSNLSCDEHLRERRKQITLVTMVYTASLVIRFSMMIGILLFSHCLDCFQFQSNHIVIANDVGGEFVLALFQLSMILPHICIPIALYLIPLRVKHKLNNISLDVVDFKHSLIDSEISSGQIQRAEEVKNKIVERSQHSEMSM